MKYDGFGKKFEFDPEYLKSFLKDRGYDLDDEGLINDRTYYEVYCKTGMEVGILMPKNANNNYLMYFMGKKEEGKEIFDFIKNYRTPVMQYLKSF
jgi:hypothetical protein